MIDGVKEEVCAVETCAPLEDGCEPYYTEGVCCPTCKFKSFLGIRCHFSAILHYFSILHYLRIGEYLLSYTSVFYIQCSIVCR